MDNEKVQVYVSGSSSKLLSKEISTSLRGRSLSYRILPLSFREFLRTKDFDFENKYFSSSEKAKLLNYSDEYLSYGGYPESVLYPAEREKILKEIIETTLYRDVIERYKIKNIKLVKIMLRHLISSKMFSVHRFYNFLKSQGWKVSKNTIYTYLEYFSDSLAIFPLRKFSLSYRKLEQSLPKVYLVSNGLFHVYGVKDKGRLMENLVFIGLLERGREENENLFYYSGINHEVDFVLTEDKGVKQLIQVCYDLTDFNTKDREVKALIQACNELGCKDLLMITWDLEGEEEIKGEKIRFVPLWKWLLWGENFQ